MQIVSGTILCGDPLVIFTGGDHDGAVSSAAHLASPLKGRRVIFIILVQWSAETEPYASELASFARQIERNRLHSCIVFCNTKAESIKLKRLGVTSFFGQQNAFIDPRIFCINRQSPPDLTAVYNAQLAPFKRHHLCSRLKSVGFVYHSFGSPEDETPTGRAIYQESLNRYEELKRKIPGARFINEELATPPHGYLSLESVTAVLNRSRVGLCLSGEEGGMHASVEYLLAGLPVVSTPSKGGRDFFFHRDFVEIADPTPEGVANAVDRVLARAPPAEEIRARTIALQQRQIDLFIKFIDGLVKAEGGAGFTRTQWDEHYCDKLLGWEPLDLFLQRIPEAIPSSRKKNGLNLLKRFRSF